jgi:hypothetical protein
MVDLNVLNKAVYGWLTGSTALTTALGGSKVYSQMAPVNVLLPYVVFRLQSGGPVNDTPREAADVIVAVIGVAETAAASETIADLIKARMHNAEITASGGWRDFRSEQIGAVQFVEQIESKQYWRAGGNYRLRSAK